MEAVIKMIKGPESGASVAVGKGDTLIGRNPKAAVRVNHGSVSFDHAIISRNGEDFYIENLSANGTFLNDVRLNAKSKLRIKDEIGLSPEVVLRFEPAPGHEPGLLANRGVLFTLVALLILGITAFVIYDSMQKPPVDQWNSAYRNLREWTQAEVAANRMNKQIDVLLEQAWRLDTAGDYRASKAVWLNLQVLMTSQNKGYAFATLSQEHPAALRVLLNPKSDSPELNNDQKAAALQQFVGRRLRFAIRNSGGGDITGIEQ